MDIKVNNVVIGSGKPKVCVPIIGKDEESILEAANLAVSGFCDLVEWRADWYQNITDEDATIEVLERLKGILNLVPIIFTVRTESEGGRLKIPFEQYSRLLLDVAKSGLAEIIDVEVFKDPGTTELISDIKNEGVIVVGSNHDFVKTGDMDELCGKLLTIADAGADIPKLAVMPQTKDDVVRLLNATYEMNRKLDNPIITMSMGQLGTISRISGETFGSAVTFAALTEASAPGQLGVDVLKSIMTLI